MGHAHRIRVLPRGLPRPAALGIGHDRPRGPSSPRHAGRAPPTMRCLRSPPCTGLADPGAGRCGPGVVRQLLA
eukprot:11274091-Alexandrium_andersonii.AAC.1